MPSSPHRLFASIVVAGMSIAGCGSTHTADAGRVSDAGRDAGRAAEDAGRLPDAGRDAGLLADAGRVADAGRDAAMVDAGQDPCASCTPCGESDPVCDVCTPCII